jgi:drug/metabolite transporter (DMT)-like permease
MKRAAAFAAVYLGWGSLYLAIRIALESFPPFILAAATMLAAGVILHVFGTLKGHTLPKSSQWAYALRTAGPLIFIGNGAVVWGEQTVPSALTAILLATEALWIALFDWVFFRGPVPAGKAFLGIAFGLIGTAVLVWTGLPSGAALDPKGLIAILVAAMSWSLGSILSRRDPAPPSAVFSTSMPMLLGGAMLALAALLTGEWARFDLSQVSVRSAAAFGHAMLVGSVAAYLAYVWLLKNVSLAKASTYAYVNPLVAVVLGWAVGGENVTLHMLAGSVLIIFSTMLILAHKEKARA